jgi:isoamyl acetate esterase
MINSSDTLRCLSRQIIFFGANDAALKQEDILNQHVPLKEYKENLKAIINHSTVTAHGTRVLLITPPPIDEYILDKNPDLRGSRKAEVTQQYAIACKEVGQSLNVPVVDLWSKMIEAVGWDPRQKVPGSKEAPKNDKLGDLLNDGMLIYI